MTLAVGPTAAALRHIEAVVAERQLGPGDKLPTERELAAEAGVSRAVVRSVLEDLEHRGTVVRYVGGEFPLGRQLVPRAQLPLGDDGFDVPQSSRCRSHSQGHNNSSRRTNSNQL